MTKTRMTRMTMQVSRDVHGTHRHVRIMLTTSRNGPGGGIELEVLIEELMEGVADQGEGSHAHEDEEGQGAAGPQRRVVRIGGGMLNPPV